MIRGAGGTRPPLPLVLAAGVVVFLVLLPLGYLVIRVASGGGRSLELLWDTETLSLVFRTVLLVIGVVTAAILVAVPFAWLVVRTDLPGRRAWATAAALPLVIPSYVAALCLLSLFGEKGLLQQALGVERLPDPTGYWGALAALTLSTYPYVFLLTQAALRDLDPGPEEAARSLGASRLRVLFRVTLPSVRPAISLGSLLVALYTLSDFGVVSLMRYDALTRAIYLQYRSLFDRTPAAVLALVLVGLTALALALEARVRSRGRSYRTNPGAARRAKPVPLGRWRAAGTRLVRARRDGIPRAAGVRSRLLAQAGDRQRPRGRDSLERGALVSRRLGPRRRRRRRRRPPRRDPRAAVPVTPVAPARTTLLRRKRTPRHRDRSFARLLCRTVRITRLPDTGPARLRVRRPVLPPRTLGGRVGARPREPARRGGVAGPRPWTASRRS